MGIQWHEMGTGQAAFSIWLVNVGAAWIRKSPNLGSLANQVATLGVWAAVLGARATQPVGGQFLVDS